MISHDIFKKFDCYRGEVEPGFRVNFLGVKTRDCYVKKRNDAKLPEKRYVTTSYPQLSVKSLEWIDVLEAVTTARNQFTMIELGAGWGYWLVNAAFALRQYSGIPHYLIGVEAEPTHFRWMKMHLNDNSINPRSCKLINASVSDKDGKEWFEIGLPDQRYGQAIVKVNDEDLSFKQRLLGKFSKKSIKWGKITVKKLKAISLNTLLRPLNFVNLIHVDVQGAELIVFKSSVEQFNCKVKRVSIGIHTQEIEVGLRSLFRDLGWQNLNDFPMLSEINTRYGKIKFRDGMQTWINPNI